MTGRYCRFYTSRKDKRSSVRFFPFTYAFAGTPFVACVDSISKIMPFYWKVTRSVCQISFPSAVGSVASGPVEVAEAVSFYDCVAVALIGIGAFSSFKAFMTVHEGDYF